MTNLATVNSDAVLNVPNLLTFASLGLGVWWTVGGGPPWSAVASVLLDELDGRVARATGETTRFGATFDWAGDLVLTGLVLNKLGAAEAIPIVTTGQVVFREAGYRPPVLSIRGALMLYGVATDQQP